MHTLIKKSEIVHTLKVDQILDLYAAKCIDGKVEYRPDQAVKFLEKIKKNCTNRKFILSDAGLGLESANVIAHLM